MKKLIILNLVLVIILIILPKQVEETKETQLLENKIIQEEVIEEVKEPEQEVIQEQITTEISRGITEPREVKTDIVDNTLEGYRVTSYYPDDNYKTGTKTGSGKTIYDFNTISINGKNVYTYKGKIVIAGATKELLKTGYNVKGSQEKQNKHYFNYYDTGKIKLYDNWYDFIILDSCGASMWKGYYRLDIFVPTSNDVIDTKNAEIIYN